MKLIKQYYSNLETFIKQSIERKLIDKNVNLASLFSKSTKILFFIIPIAVMVLVVVIELNIHAQFTTIKSNLFEIINVGLTENLKLAMNTNDFLKVRNTLDEIRMLDTVEDVTLVDKNKKIIIADSLQKEGGYLDYEELNQAFQSDIEEKYIRTNERLVFIFENEASCRRCHLEDEEILGGLVVSFSSFDHTTQTVLSMLFMMTIIIVFVFVARIFFVSVIDRYINLPIDNLIKTSKSILKGEPITGYKVGTPEEFSYIFNVLSKMAGDIDEYIEEIKRKNSEKEQIKILAGIGEMAAKVAHEVRNPLNTIDGAIHYLRKTGNNDQNTLEYLDLIQENINRINNVASELLGATRPTKPVLEKINVVNVLRDRIQEFYETYNITEVEINLEAIGEIPIMFIDRNKIIQVIDNLLENAINAIEDKENGIINISVKKISPTPLQNFLLMRFVDNGCGIPKENIDRLLIPFYTTRGNGTGLGLSIVDKIISNHRGEIKIFSKVNKGTIVRIKIPVRT